MHFGINKKPKKSDRKLAKSKKDKQRLKNALIEDPSVRCECRLPEDAEDIYDEDDFNR